RHAVVQTTSPSMDIQISSNFERLLFEAGGRDGAATASLMARMAQSPATSLPESVVAAIRAGFGSGRAVEAEVAATIADTLRRTGYLLDPHSAVGVHVARGAATRGVPMVSL